MFVVVRLDRTIQYSETSAMESGTCGVLDTRRNLPSGAHSRDPVAGMTVVDGATSLRAKRSNPEPQRKTGLLRRKCSSQ